MTSIAWTKDGDMLVARVFFNDIPLFVVLNPKKNTLGIRTDFQVDLPDQSNDLYTIRDGFVCLLRSCDSTDSQDVLTTVYNAVMSTGLFPIEGGGSS